MSRGKYPLGSVIRLDKPKDDPVHGTHGWQVRLPTGEPRKYYSKMFSDNLFGGREQAFQAAEAHLREQIETDPKFKSAAEQKRRFRTKPLSNNRSGIMGVYRTHAYHKSGKKQEYWAAYCPIGPDNGKPWTKRFYISDVNYDEEQARQAAIDLRQMWQEAALQGEETLRRFFYEYESGWL
jgi:hypothetical protein